MKRLILYLLLILIITSCTKEKNEVNDNSELIGNEKSLLLNFYTRGLYSYDAFSDTENLIRTITNKSLKAEFIMIHDTTVMLMKEIRSIDSLVVVATGGLDDYGKFRRINEVEAINETLVNTEVSQKLEDALTDYSVFLKENGVIINELPIIPGQNELTSHIPEYKNLSFSEFHFKDTDLITAMDALNYYRAVIVHGERVLISNLMVKEVNENGAQH